MADLKTVIKGLRKCSIDDVDCKHCPYNGKGNAKRGGCESVMQRDAYKLLRKQDEEIKTLSAFARADGIDVDALLGRKVDMDA